MKIKQIIQALPKLVIVYNDCDEDGSMVTAVDDVIAYGLMDDGRVLPLVIGKNGALSPVDQEGAVSYFADDDND